MNVLFLTSSPGYGHTRAAEAIELALRDQYPTLVASRVDVTDLFDPDVGQALQDGYLELTADHPVLYQKLYDLDKGVYQQLAGTQPADRELIEFLLRQQQRWQHAQGEQTRFPFPAGYQSVDSALLNSLINGMANRSKIPGGQLLLKGLLGIFYRILASRLKNAVLAANPDLIVATQMYPNALLSRYVQNGVITQPIVGVLTDYGAHGLWARNSTELFCVSHENVARTLRDKGINGDQISVTGIPLMPGFTAPPSQFEARQSLGLDATPTVLVTGGQCGIGLYESVKRMVEDPSLGYRVLITAGRAPADPALLALEQQAPRRLKVLPWSDNMVNLLRAADVVVGKPGGLTVSESLASGRPFIATCCLGGQEQHNVDYLQTHQVGKLIKPEALPSLLNEWFGDRGGIAAKQRRAELLGKPYAARYLVAEIDRLLHGKHSVMWKQQSVRE